MKKNIYWMFALSLLLSACGKEQEIAAATAERPASTVVVGALGDERSNVYSGEIRARYETVLGFRIGGKIIARAVDVPTPTTIGWSLPRAAWLRSTSPRLAIFPRWQVITTTT